MKDFTKWLSNYSERKNGEKKVDYLLIPELGKNGAWHIHGLMSGIPREHLSFFEKGKHFESRFGKKYLNWKAYEMKFGFCSFGKIRNKEKIAGYITKYIRQPAKMQERELHSRLYYNTRGLKRPTEINRGYNLVNIDKYDFENEIDISVSGKNENNKNNMVAIEIENISNFDQAERNIDKMKNWVNKSKYRNCSLLHMFNKSGIGKDEKSICALIKHGKNLEFKQEQSRFFYDFYFFDLINSENIGEEHKIAKKCAEDICKSYNFQIRLWQLLIQIGLVVN